MIKNYKIKLHILSPIHIGSGDGYEPTQFTFDSNGQMCVFDTNDFVKTLTPDKLSDLSKLSLDSQNPIPLFRFFRDNFDKNKVKHRALRASSDLAKKYQEICNKSSFKNEVINQFELKKTISNPITNLPYIPGSSLKGCIKTFVMSEINKKNMKIEGERNIKTLEEKILKGSFSSDPFRFVKISDLYPVITDDEAYTEIAYAVMIPKKPQKQFKSDLAVALEVIKKGIQFKGTISLDDQQYLPKDGRSNYAINMAILKTASKGYYAQKILKENQLLQKLKANQCQIVDTLQEKLFKTCFFVRLGHHSSAEFITIDNNKRIKISPPHLSPPKFGDSATTIWLAGKSSNPLSCTGMDPFGWGLIELVD